MRVFITVLIAVLFLNARSQQATFRTYSSVIKLSANQGDNNYQWKIRTMLFF
jgi:hypothetical protein